MRAQVRAQRKETLLVLAQSRARLVWTLHEEVCVKARLKNASMLLLPTYAARASTYVSQTTAFILVAREKTNEKSSFNLLHLH